VQIMEAQVRIVRVFARRNKNYLVTVQQFTAGCQGTKS
jgi:hypothetical protein